MILTSTVFGRRTQTVGRATAYSALCNYAAVTR